MSYSSGGERPVALYGRKRRALPRRRADDHDPVLILSLHGGLRDADHQAAGVAAMCAAANAVPRVVGAAGMMVDATGAHAAAADVAVAPAWKEGVSRAGPSWRHWRRFSSNGDVAVVVASARGPTAAWHDWMVALCTWRMVGLTSYTLSGRVMSR